MSQAVQIQSGLQARVVLIGGVRGFDELTYAIPPELADRLKPGHRVLAPLRTRRVTGVVLEVGSALGDGAGSLKPILELLEPSPLFDRAHLELMAFLADYYMVPLADVYRVVIPAVARVESKVIYAIRNPPTPLREAAMTPEERAIVEALSKRPMNTRQLSRLTSSRAGSAALAALIGEGIVESRDAMHGRHRESDEHLIVRLVDDADISSLRGRRQREVAEVIASTGPDGIVWSELEQRMQGTRQIVRALSARGLVAIEEPRTNLPSSNGQTATSPPYELTPEQMESVGAIAARIDGGDFETFLLWGVTGSGKTEVYLQVAARALAAGRQVIVMVPEIALADELVRSFRARFGDLVGIAHSAQTVAERWSSWKAALAGQARIMIGPRSLIFAPIHDAGVIIVDEEHDAAYKNEEGIRYHARDLAVVLGRFAKCPVILGSATPSAESFANTRRGRYRMLRLPRRINDRAMAAVEVVDLRKEFARKADAKNPPANEVPANLPISRPLIEALRANLASGGQAIVFLNRRGYHNFLQCHLCGNVIACSDCSVSMTFHLRDRSLRCHYCGNRFDAPDRCPACGQLGLKGEGFGTERLESALGELVPGARIERMDSDTSGRKGARSQILAGLRAREIDILVGTQMITKGFDFPGVTLAAVVAADASLNMPDFRSAERTFQLLTQVAGRAGRGEHPGRVIVQTYAPHHYSIRAACDQDYARFIRRELDLRRELFYPPFARLAMVRIEGEHPEAVERIASRAAEALSVDAKPESMRVLGPAPAPIERIRKRYRWQVMVKSANIAPMRAALAAMRAKVAEHARRESVYLIIDIDPVSML